MLMSTTAKVAPFPQTLSSKNWKTCFSSMSRFFSRQTSFSAPAGVICSLRWWSQRRFAPARSANSRQSGYLATSANSRQNGYPASSYPPSGYYPPSGNSGNSYPPPSDRSRDNFAGNSTPNARGYPPPQGQGHPPQGQAGQPPMGYYYFPGGSGTDGEAQGGFWWYGPAPQPGQQPPQPPQQHQQEEEESDEDERER